MNNRRMTTARTKAYEPKTNKRKKDSKKDSIKTKQYKKTKINR